MARSSIKRARREDWRLSSIYTHLDHGNGDVLEAFASWNERPIEAKKEIKRVYSRGG